MAHKPVLINPSEVAARTDKLREKAMGANDPASEAFFRYNGGGILRKTGRKLPNGEEEYTAIKHQGHVIFNFDRPTMEKDGWVLYMAGMIDDNSAFDAPTVHSKSGGLGYLPSLREMQRKGEPYRFAPMNANLILLYGVGPDNPIYVQKLAWLRFVLDMQCLEKSNKNMSILENVVEQFAADWHIHDGSVKSGQLNQELQEHGGMHAPAKGEWHGSDGIAADTAEAQNKRRET